MDNVGVRVLSLGSVLLLSAANLCLADCNMQPDGTTCDAGSDHPYAMVCAGGACVPCAADTGASPQFVDNGDGTITDRHTCLVWEKKDNAGGIHDLNNVYQWSSSGSAMDGGAFTVFLAALNGAAFAGHQDWRLPTAAGKTPPTGQPAEAESIEVNVTCGPTDGGCQPAAFNTNCGPYGPSDPPATTTSNPGCTVDGAGGTSMCSCAPFYHSWTASTVAGSPDEGWLECYTATGNGLSSPSKTDAYNVRAVRGGGTASSFGCSPTPLGGCLQPGKATLSVTSNALNHDKDRLRWVWSKGAAFAATDLGDPTQTTNYAICVYAGGSLLAQSSIPAGSLWRAIGSPPRGYRFNDKTASHDGIATARATSGAATKTKAQVVGRGASLPFIALPLGPSQLPVTVQLVNDGTAQCWSAAYTNAPTKNTAGVFKALLP
jgi:hypothetical protein